MKKKRIKIALIFAVILGVVAVGFLTKSFAYTDAELKAIYMNWNFPRYSMVMDMLRYIGWFIITALGKLVGYCANLVTSAMKFLTFGTSTFVNNLMQTYFTPLFAALLGIGLTLLGIAITFLLNVDRNKLIINFVMLIIAMFALPTFMSGLEGITSSTMTWLLGGGNGVYIDAQTGQEKQITSGDDIAFSQIQPFLIDFDYVAKQGFQKADGKIYNNLKAENLKFIRINETFGNNPQEEVFKKEYDVSTGKIQNAVWHDFFGVFGEYYYKYSFSFFSIIISQLATCLVFFFMSYKIIRISWELGFARTFVALLAPVEMTSGERTKKALINIVSMYASLVFVVVAYRLFNLGCAFIATSSINAFLKPVFILFLALATIDGPNLIEQILGLDIGLKSVAGSIMGAYHGAKMAAGVAGGFTGGVGNAVGNMAKGAAKAAFYAGKMGQAGGGASDASNLYSGMGGNAGGDVGGNASGNSNGGVFDGGANANENNSGGLGGNASQGGASSQDGASQQGAKPFSNGQFNGSVKSGVASSRPTSPGNSNIKGDGNGSPYIQGMSQGGQSIQTSSVRGGSNNTGSSGNILNNYGFGGNEKNTSSSDVAQGIIHRHIGGDDKKMNKE